MSDIKKIKAILGECNDILSSYDEGDLSQKEREVINALYKHCWKLSFYSNDAEKSQKLETKLAAFLAQNESVIQESNHDGFKELLAASHELILSPQQEIELLCQRSSDFILDVIHDLNEAANISAEEDKKMASFLGMLEISIEKNWPEINPAIDLVSKFRKYVDENMVNAELNSAMLGKVYKSLSEKDIEKPLSVIDSLQVEVAKRHSSSEGILALTDIYDTLARLTDCKSPADTRKVLSELTNQIKEFHNLDSAAHKDIAKKLMKTCEKISEVNQKTAAKDFDPKLQTTTPKFNK